MSNKFTGITSAGSAIPVYDKAAHEGLSAKLDASALEPAISGKADTSAIPSLDGYATEQWVGEQGYLTEVPESAVSGFATHDEVESATSGKADTSALSAKLDTSAVGYGWTPEDTLIVTGVSGREIYATQISPNASALKELRFIPVLSAHNQYNLGVSASPINGITLYNSGGLSDTFTVSSIFSNSAHPGFFKVNGWGYNEDQSITVRDGLSGIDRIKIAAGITSNNPSITLRGSNDQNNNGVFIDVNGASAVDYAGNVKWQVGGPAKQLLHGGTDPVPGLLFVATPTGASYSANYSAVPHLSADYDGIRMTYGTNSPSASVNPSQIKLDYQSAHLVADYNDVKVSTYTAFNDPDRKDWSLTGSVQKLEIECDSATSAITAIAGSAIGGFIVSADPFVQHDNSLSGNGTVNSPLGVVPGYNETVLYNASGNWASACDMSENADNFNEIKIWYDEAYGNNGARSISIPTEFLSFSGGNEDTFFLSVPFYYQNKINTRGGKYSFTSKTKFELGDGIQVNMNALTTASNTVSYAGYYHAGAYRQTSVRILKIVGVNRKA